MKDYLTRLWAVFLGRATGLESYLEDMLNSTDKALGYTDASSRYPHDREKRIANLLSTQVALRKALAESESVVRDLQKQRQELENMLEWRASRVRELAVERDHATTDRDLYKSQLEGLRAQARTVKP